MLSLLFYTICQLVFYFLRKSWNFNVILVEFFMEFLCMAGHQLKKQKQPSRSVLRKRYSENIQQIYRRTHVLNCDLNKVAL